MNERHLIKLLESFIYPKTSSGIFMYTDDEGTMMVFNDKEVQIAFEKFLAKRAN